MDQNQFVGREGIMKAAGVETRKLGYVGLEVGRISVAAPILAALDGIDDAYPFVHHAQGDWRTWVDGAVAENGGHITAKYGLLTPAYEQRNLISELIGEGYPIGQKVWVTGFEAWESPYEDLDYVCLVARVGADWLDDLNAALSVLPHVDSFAQYKPHITLAYVRPDLSAAALPGLAGGLYGESLEIIDIDYGKVGGF